MEHSKLPWHNASARVCPLFALNMSELPEYLRVVLESVNALSARGGISQKLTHLKEEKSIYKFQRSLLKLG